MTANRLQIPFSASEVDRLKDQIPVVQEDELWHRVVTKLLGTSRVPAGVDTLTKPPTTLPQLVNVLAGLGLRVVEDLEADLSYEELFRSADDLPRALPIDGSGRQKAIAADGLLP